jgi:LCP family protein required for cell wall assembly
MWERDKEHNSEKILFAPVLVAAHELSEEYAPSRELETIKSETTYKASPEKPAKKPFNWLKSIIVSVILFSIGLFGFGGYVFATKALSTASKTTGQSGGDILGGFFQGFTNNSTPLAGQTEGRTNFLVLGVDGSGFLADSISLVSYFYDTKEFTSIHVPRDMTVSSQYGRTKINEFFSYAESTGDRNGPKELAELLENELAIKFHYWVQFNFTGVRQLVDAVGGVDVNVQSSFTDCNYPADQPGVSEGECIKFKAGVEHMEGNRALIYARSRYSWDNVAEASDFARGKRQSIVVESLLKAMSLDAKNKGGIFDTKKLSTYLDVLGDNMRTSIKVSELKGFYDTFYKQLGGVDNLKFTKISWDTSNPLFTDGNSDAGGYRITYADGKVIGDGLPSTTRTTIRNQVQDPRVSGKNALAKKASLIVLGNGSGKVTQIFKEIKKLGFTPCEGCYDDGYTNIKVSANQKITVYVPDSDLRKEVDELLKNATFSYTLEGALPPNKILTPNNQGVDITVWIE